MEEIRIRGARTHNLKNVSLDQLVTRQVETDVLEIVGASPTNTDFLDRKSVV